MRRTHALLIVSIVLFLAGCAGNLDRGTAERTASVAGDRGVDYSFSRPSSPQALRGAGYTFACRYLSYDGGSSHGKILFRDEADALRAAGVDIVANWEYSADDALGGFDSGVSDAQTAQAQAAAAGTPAGRPIYFSVDFDATPGQQDAINSYFDGVASVIGHTRTGAYGGYYVIQRLFDAGKIQWGWQTYAWSGGQWDPRAQLRQVQNGVNVAGADADIDVATADDFGQWGAAQTSCNGHTTQGAIAAEYASLGGCGSFLGPPTTDETATADGVGRFNHFQNGGSIYWTPDTGAHEVHGDIHAKWSALGWERSPLGYPIIDESPCADGVGRYSEFQNGSIYWTPSNGAFEVHGAIFTEWAAMSWEQGVLGYPTTDEEGALDGVGRYSHFQGGSIYWTPQTGAHEVNGDINATWASLGWERSSLGYPISDEYDAPGGRRSDFQHGSLVWNAQTRVVTVVP